MNAAYLIQTAEQSGGQLLAEGEYIRIVNIKRLPVSLVEAIKSQKKNLLKILKQNEKAEKAGFVIALTGELYTQTLGRNSVVYVEQIGSRWEAWRETHRPGKKKPIHFKIIAASEEFEYVLLKAKNYFDYIEQKRSGGNLKKVKTG
ncbi:hypothetical protein K7T73_04335 [Bacillus badius]|uniref:hypothetical protein n=1 Tax=Bacillus badius TaxID=1455 RepID=UPI001CC0A89A|nr:hypothetical protein [Bacillus badius]UAT31467.1 hypothetical protein K7T73_04335 [Bacillus badius]